MKLKIVQGARRYTRQAHGVDRRLLNGLENLKRMDA